MLETPKFVNIKSYDGEIVCKNCGARLAVKFVGSPKPVKYKLVEKPRKELDAPINIVFKEVERK